VSESEQTTMLQRLLITGAGGNLGRLARSRVGHLAHELRLSDIAAMEPAGAREEVVSCNLADFDAVQQLVEGCDGILHLGGMSVENTFEVILEANIRGLYNIYEAARRSARSGSKPRFFFASSNHTIGFHARDTRLDANSPLRPDSLYGVSKCFGEAVARLYFDKFGIETAIVRIGSCFEEPREPRMLATWLSPDDFIGLIERVFSVPRLGCPIIYGASGNDESWWDNREVAWLGWRPKDNAERYRARFSADDVRQGGDRPAVIFQGGGFAEKGHFED
jgi:uronate dehydrogenase